MRTYTELWNYTLTSSSLPYAIDHGSPAVVFGNLRLPTDTFVNKDYAGTEYHFQGQNYSGNYALKFTLDTTSVDVNSIFTVLCYGDGSYLPGIKKTASGVFQFGYTTYDQDLIGTSPSGPSGDFTGLDVVTEDGLYTVVFLKQPGAQSGWPSKVAMHVVTPLGVHYASGWMELTDDARHNQIGNNTLGAGYWEISSIEVNDELTVEAVENILVTGELSPQLPSCIAPVITPIGGTYGSSVSVSITCETAGATIYYTTDGSTPTSASSVYTSSFNLTSTSTVNAFATATNYNDSTVTSSTYTVIFSGPIRRLEPWVDNGAWQFSGKRSMTNGILTVDADANGSVSSVLCSRDLYSPTFSRERPFKYQCLELDVTLTGSLRFGLHNEGPEFSSNMRMIEFVKNNNSVSFFIRGTGATLITGFDGSLSISSDAFKIRCAWSEIDRLCRFAIYSGSTLIADTNWLASYEALDAGKNNALVANLSSFNNASSSGLSSHFWQMGTGAGALEYQTIFDTVGFSALSGTTTIAPYTSIVNCNHDEAGTYVSTGNITLLATPSNPQISIQDQSNGVRLVTITPDIHSKVIATINEGGFVQTAFDVLTNNRSIVGTVGQPLVMMVADPSVFRVICYNGEISSEMLTQYVGPTTSVAIPEISPRSGGIVTGAALQVTMHCTDSQAEIRYTTDGTEPDETSTLYSGPVFIRSILRLAAKSFKLSAQSLTKYAQFWERFDETDSDIWASVVGSNVFCVPISDSYSSSYWQMDGNATLDSGNSRITVNDPSGLGVTFRSDVLPSFHDRDMYTVAGFLVSGNFRLKIPGRSKHFACVGGYAGPVADTSAVPPNSTNGSTHFQVVVTFLVGLVHSISLIGYDATETQVWSCTFLDSYSSTDKIDGDAITALSFTSEGVSAYQISNLQMMLVNLNGNNLPSYPWVFPGKAVFSGISSDLNFAGKTVTVTPEIPGQSILTLIASAMGEAPPTYSTTANASFVPMATDQIGRLHLVARTTSSSGLCQLTSICGHGNKVFTEIGSWDIKRDLSDVYFVKSYSSSVLQTKAYLDAHVHANLTDGGEYPVLSGDFIHRFHEYELNFPHATMDTGSAWYRFRYATPFRNGFSDSYLCCGWATDRISVNEVALINNVTENSVSTQLCESSMHNQSPATYLQSVNTSTWLPVSSSRPVYIASYEQPVWHCGRKISSGHLYLRTMLTPNLELNSVIFDTGWVDCGIAPSNLPRPRILFRKRRVQECRTSNELTGYSFQRGYSNLTELQVDNCFDYGTPNPPTAPVLTDSTGTPIENYLVGTVPESNNFVALKWNPGVGDAAIYIKAGIDTTLYRRNNSFTPRSKSYDEGLVTSNNAPSTTLELPSVSQARAVVLCEPIANYDGYYTYDGRSATRTINFSHQTTDYVTVNATIPHHVYIQFDKSQLPTISSIGSEPTFWKLVFSDGYEYSLSASASDDVERIMDPGTYTVKLARYGSDGESRSLGETIPASFTVPDRIALSISAPTSVVLGTPTLFSASVSGGVDVTYLWSFSDNVSEKTSSVSRTFLKPGRYSWSVRAVDATGDAAQSSGQFVVPFTGTIPTGYTVPTTETRIS